MLCLHTKKFGNYEYEKILILLLKPLIYDPIEGRYDKIRARYLVMQIPCVASALVEPKILPV